ncbi:MAG: hypothetical protein K6E63_09075 [Lachnospiraceae bacterium]|nr:hypothetical protein [Lachnospiraceae bacterium]
MEKTREIHISNDEATTATALKLTDEFIEKLGLEGKKAIRFRLISEETIGMVRAMTGDFEALFWLENDGDAYRVKLIAKTEMDIDKKDSLIAASTSKKNAAVKGIMGKIGEIIENGLLNYDDVAKLQQEYGSGYLDYASMGFNLSAEYVSSGAPLMWSLSNYREQLEDAVATNAPAREAWDELEESIVASIAEDITVGVKKDRVDMTITARF